MYVTAEGKRTLNRSLPETWVKRVRHLVENIRRHLLAMFVEEVDLDGPRTEGEALHAGILVPKGRRDHQQKFVSQGLVEVRVPRHQNEIS